MSKSITENASASVVYHTGAFTPAKKIMTGGAGAAGAVILVLGILGYFFYHQIPLAATGTAMGVGGLLVVVDGVALAFMVRKHLKIKSPLEELFNAQSNDPAESLLYLNSFNALGKVGRKCTNLVHTKSDEVVSNLKIPVMYSILESDEGTRTIHHFPSREAMDSYLKSHASTRGTYHSTNAKAEQASQDSLNGRFEHIHVSQ